MEHFYPIIFLSRFSAVSESRDRFFTKITRIMHQCFGTKRPSLPNSLFWV